MANTIEEILGAAGAIAKGMSVTFKEMMSPTVTEYYPDEPAKFEERFRGVHVLQRDANGMEKCVACFLCAAACPANCIYIEAAENTDKVRISGGERYASVYNIDYNRCIFCGYCVEACPTDAITHGHGFEGRQLQHFHAGQAEGRHAGPDSRRSQTAGDQSDQPEAH
jgi:NADH-quinone oxidoreductase subunit I